MSGTSHTSPLLRLRLLFSSLQPVRSASLLCLTYADRQVITLLAVGTAQNVGHDRKVANVMGNLGKT